MTKSAATTFEKENPGFQSNRRRFKRYAYFESVRIYSNEFEKLDMARCTNLGLGGMRLVTNLQTLIEGSQIVIEFKDPESKKYITLLGEVRYSVCGEESDQECGVAFLSMNEDLNKHVEKLVEGCSEI